MIIFDGCGSFARIAKKPFLELLEGTSNDFVVSESYLGYLKDVIHLV